MTGLDLPTLQALAAEARAVNAANGWGLEFKPADLPNYVALLHSEVTEAWYAISPDELVRELGDVIVRALDLAELLSPGALEETWLATPYAGGPTLERAAWPEMFDPRIVSEPVAFLTLHSHISATLESYRKVKGDELMVSVVLGNLCDVVAYTKAVMKARKPECVPSLIVQDIITANRARAYRHGGRRT